MNSKEPTIPPRNEGNQNDQVNEELLKLSSELAKVRQDMADLVDSFEKSGETTSDDREHAMDLLADELDRLSIQIDACDISDPARAKVHSIVTDELDFASDVLRDSVDAFINMDGDAFIDLLNTISPSIEEADIVLDLLRVAHTASAIGVGTYLHDNGQCGYSPKKQFDISPLATKLEHALQDMHDCTIGEDFNTFNPEKKGDLMFIGEVIKGVLSIIIRTLDETKGDPIERAIRLVSVKLEAVLAIMREELELENDIFYSPTIIQVLNREISGGFCLERIKQDMLAHDRIAMEELEGAVNIMKLVAHIASR